MQKKILNITIKDVIFYLIRQHLKVHIRQSTTNIHYQRNYQGKYRVYNQRIYHDSTIKRNHLFLYVCRRF